MNRQRKNSVPLSFKLDKDIADMLQNFVGKTGMSKTATVERALREFIEKYNRTGKI